MLTETLIDTIELRKTLVQCGFNDYEIEGIFKAIESSSPKVVKLNGD